ncbi:MAG: amino acid adenylation domain-containing protein, partial [Chloroflexi bacterium]|nr:amino acid adenylation domain-containing protein [Chloroflexota bacterium]
MDDLSRRIAGLSPEKRALLERELMKRGTDDVAIGVIPRRADTGNIPLSFAQQRLWFLAQLEPDSPAYNMPKAMHMRGPLNVAALQRSLNEIIARHEVMRTRYVSTDGIPTQVVADGCSIDLPVIDMTDVPGADREHELQRVMSEEAGRRFDLSTDLTLRAALIKLDLQEHVLLLTTHHIASDGWSTGVLTRELSALYAAYCEGRPSPLGDLPIQYSDYSQWQRDWLRGEVLDSQLAYWRDRLADAAFTLDLPTDRPRPAEQTYRGKRRSLLLPAALSDSLKVLSRQEGATLFMTLLAAFKTLLFRQTGQEDIVVGSPIAGRKHAETEQLIGFFVNNLVLRTDLAGDPTFVELLSRVRRHAVDAYENQDIPFEKLVEALQPKRDPSRHPLFQVMFALQNTPREEFELAGLTVSALEIESRGTPFDLTLSVAETEGRLTTSVTYNTDLFDSLTIDRMLDQYRVLLQGIAAEPTLRISRLPLLTKEERRKIVEEWNDTRVDYPSEALVHRLFEAQVESNPDAAAVEFAEARMTYRELDRRANKLAHHLRKLGVRSEVLVGVNLERSLDMVVAMLGILKAGGAYLPLDPAYPAERLEFMLRDANVRFVLTHSNLCEALPDTVDHVVCVDVDSRDIGNESDANPSSMVGAENLAYVIYTSGSTGRPKGVQVTHRALANCLKFFAEEPGISKTDTLLAVTTLSFDIATLELLLPLTVGARVVIVGREEASDGAGLADRLATSHATIMQATPATWRLLLQAGWRGDSSLKVLCGGDALPRDLADGLLATGAMVWNLYGPTETTIWSAIQRVEPGEGPVPIGRPIANTRMHILDANLQPVPVGVSGHIYIGGHGLARGYLGWPELTDERFISDPLGADSASRLYMTGDLGKYLADGSIQYLGRTDNQVKLRGFRIELGEIESVLGQNASVGEAVVCVREYGSEDHRLVAYVVPADGSAFSESELRDHLRRKLPDYMVPADFVLLDALPLTPNGKVDRKALT